MGTLITCGCGRHHVPSAGRHTVSWRGEQWDAGCAFEVAKKELEKNPKKDDLRQVIAQMPCYLCEKPVGRQYEIHGTQVCHVGCSHDLGGGS